ncbi:hypothetical protein HJC23_003657 [Cyclotella cryptica]|uniref:CAAX prenyl protease 2/Lysostaphin resistance protein A-like domain-containing protein n=1 Tax=Cyclotella cryptica TaxID=29204 RepID=A0ABD3QLH9_9STRA|eukprot:CCRYP_004944-RA/>CCRYP_004944-RA protein AED:0.13 eAED:0.13 QI:2747/1/1/1/0.75/0.6/5/1363/514
MERNTKRHYNRNIAHHPSSRQSCFNMVVTFTAMAVMMAISRATLTPCHGFGLSPIHTVNTRSPIPSIGKYTSSIRTTSSRKCYSVKCQRLKPLPASSTKYQDNQGSRRPPWALPWMPTALISLRPATQFIIGLALYIFHLRILTQHGIAFPFQLIPNEHGWFTSIGLDSLAGMFSFAGLVWLRKASVRHVQNEEKKTDSDSADKDMATAAPMVAVPPLWSKPTENESPWRLHGKNKQQDNDEVDLKGRPHPRSTSVIAFVLLTIAYFSTGRFSLLFENGLYAAAGYGLPLTVAMHRSLVVLLGHLTWVVVGSAILAGVLSPKPFFGGGWTTEKTTSSKGKRGSGVKDRKILRPYRWYTNKWDTYWLWWTIGGYFVSAWLFNVADFLNQILLPPELFAQQAEGVVSQLINPENNDFLASLVGYIAPCLSAPWWEEVLYRGYLLPALGLFMGFWPSVFVSGVLFSVHHLSVMGAIPLAVLGWVWAALYAKSGNILVTILIHGMWNSRVFLGSWLGL